MKKIRIGNDVPIRWSIKRELLPEVLTGKDVKVKLFDKNDRVQVFDWMVIGGRVVGTYFGKDQKTPGKYRLLLIENDGEDSMVTLDALDAFELVMQMDGRTQDGEDVGIETDPVVLQGSINTGGDSQDLPVGGFVTHEELVAALDGKVDAVDGRQLSEANYTAAEKTKLAGIPAGAVDKMVDDLVNYYLKAEVYTKNEVQQMFGAIRQLEFIPVAVLPVASAETMGNVYMVPSADPKTQNIKDEYITILDGGSYKWEHIGSTSFSPSNYYDRTAIDGMMQGKQNTIADLGNIRQGASAGATAVQPQALQQYYSKTEIDAMTWFGSRAEYDAITNKDENVIYNILED